MVFLALYLTEVFVLDVPHTTSQGVWNHLFTFYTNKSNPPVMGVKNYYQGWTWVLYHGLIFTYNEWAGDELTMIDALLPNDYLIVHVLNGLGFGYN